MRRSKRNETNKKKILQKTNSSENNKIYETHKQTNKLVTIKIKKYNWFELYALKFGRLYCYEMPFVTLQLHCLTHFPFLRFFSYFPCCWTLLIYNITWTRDDDNYEKRATASSSTAPTTIILQHCVHTIFTFLLIILSVKTKTHSQSALHTQKDELRVNIKISV